MFFLVFSSSSSSSSSSFSSSSSSSLRSCVCFCRCFWCVVDSWSFVFCCPFAFLILILMMMMMLMMMMRMGMTMMMIFLWLSLFCCPCYCLRFCAGCVGLLLFSLFLLSRLSLQVVRRSCLSKLFVVVAVSKTMENPRKQKKHNWNNHGMRARKPWKRPMKTRENFLKNKTPWKNPRKSWKKTWENRGETLKNTGTKKKCSYSIPTRLKAEGGIEPRTPPHFLPGGLV